MKQWPTVRPRAELDIAEAALWYEAERAGLGGEFLSEVDNSLQRIGDNPMQFPELDLGVRRALLRRFPYAVYFVMDSRPPTILAVLHLHRHPEAWKDRRQ